MVDVVVAAVDRRIADLARLQHGVVSRAQLLELGITEAEIKWRIRVGRLHPVHRGVYLVGHAKPLPLAPEIAAVLACGPRSVVSHRSATTLFRILPSVRGPIEVTVVGADRRRRGITVHQTPTLARRDVRTLDRIPLTSPARTLLDVSPLLPFATLERAVAEAMARRIVRQQHLEDQLARNPGRAGTPSLLALVDGATPSLTRSEAERKLLALLRAAELPAPETNQRLFDYEPDFLWRDERVVVEVDGFRFHSTRRAFEADRRRDADLAARGYTVLRITWRQMADHPHAVVARNAAALARASIP